MSRTWKDRGFYSRWFISTRGSKAWKRSVRGRVRVHERARLSKGIEPDPIIYAEREYFD